METQSWKIQNHAWSMGLFGTMVIIPLIAGGTCQMAPTDMQCCGEYVVRVTYQNTSSDAVHLWEASTEQIGPDNKLESGATASRAYNNSFFQNVYSDEDTDEDELACANYVAYAKANPHDWRFYAGQSGQTIATTSTTITQTDVEAYFADTISYIDLVVAWDGMSLTVTRQWISSRTCRESNRSRIPIQSVSPSSDHDRHNSLPAAWSMPGQSRRITWEWRDRVGYPDGEDMTWEDFIPTGETVPSSEPSPCIMDAWNQALTRANLSETAGNGAYWDMIVTSVCSVSSCSIIIVGQTMW